MFIRSPENLYYPDKLIKINQSEHARAAAELGNHWGNSQFQRPEHFDSFIQALGYHHMGAFGLDDNINLVGLSCQELAHLFEKENNPPIEDIIAQTHIQLHNSRIISACVQMYPDSTELQQVFGNLWETIYTNIDSLGIDEQYFRNVDTIIQFLDKMSFDLCGGKTDQRTYYISSDPLGNTTQQVDYSIETSGRRSVINVSPWPFNRSTIPQIVRGIQATSVTNYSNVIFPYVVQQQ